MSDVEANTSLQSLTFECMRLDQPKRAKRALDFLSHIKSQHLQKVEFRSRVLNINKLFVYSFRHIDNLITHNTLPALAVVQFVFPSHVRSAPRNVAKLLHMWMPGIVSRGLLQVEYENSG